VHLGQVDMKGMRSCVRLSVLAPVIDPGALEIGVIAAMCPPGYRREKEEHTLPQVGGASSLALLVIYQ
jgi:hypothetical protein